MNAKVTRARVIGALSTSIAGMLLAGCTAMPEATPESRMQAINAELNAQTAVLDAEMEAKLAATPTAPDMYYGSREGRCRGTVLEVVDDRSLVVMIETCDGIDPRVILVTGVSPNTSRFTDGDRYGGTLRETGRASHGSATLRQYVEE